MSAFKYLTHWSILINFVIFFVALVAKIPRWLFLFAACFLTMTSVIGTFFINVPALQINKMVYKTTARKLMLGDFAVHMLPLLIFFILLITHQYHRVFNVDDSVSVVNTVASVLIVGLVYMCSLNFENIYHSYNIYTLVALCIVTFLASYQIYAKHC